MSLKGNEQNNEVQSNELHQPIPRSRFLFPRRSIHKSLAAVASFMNCRDNYGNSTKEWHSTRQKKVVPAVDLHDCSLSHPIENNGKN